MIIANDGSELLGLPALVSRESVAGAGAAHTDSTTSTVVVNPGRGKHNPTKIVASDRRDATLELETVAA
jgi:hypothetical protein